MIKPGFDFFIGFLSIIINYICLDIPTSNPRYDTNSDIVLTILSKTL